MAIGIWTSFKLKLSARKLFAKTSRLVFDICETPSITFLATILPDSINQNDIFCFELCSNLGLYL